MPNKTLLLVISLVQNCLLKTPNTEIHLVIPLFPGPGMAVPPEAACVYEIGDLVPQVQ